MKYSGIADLPPSASGLTLIQKVNVLKSANILISQGHEREAAALAAIDVCKTQKATKIQKSATLTTVSKGSEEEQMISYEVIYEPNTPDTHGEWMSKETLVKAQADFTAAQASGAVTENLFHLYDTKLFTIESTWIQPELDVSVVGSGEIIKAGTWVAKVQYHDKGLWDLKKAGVVGGLSVQCSGLVNTETKELTGLNFGIELEEVAE